MQFYYAAMPTGEPLFLFGRLRYLTESSIVLSSGAELALDKITHIDRVPLLKRTLWTSLILGTATGVAAVATQASPTTTVLMMAPAISLNLHYGVKYNRRHLKRNQVGYVVDVTILPESP
ncbi:hypothetical protein HNQ92_003841 [Rhabdobacter roseus]|uniref:Uncharacterized protein n=1 Tax=Rhabdobacter roseus TaxID=1655419 RepID=A0A840TPI6_9BACT|nr:hypothetical protein [Rhabdobacter roseus]MBB5285681.1 hypothetical protein [Rhabdobacter roseus]